MMDLADLDAMLAETDAKSAKLQSDYRSLRKKSSGKDSKVKDNRTRRKNAGKKDTTAPRAAVSPRVRQAAAAAARTRSPREVRKKAAAKSGGGPHGIGANSPARVVGALRQKRGAAAAPSAQNFVSKVASNVRQQDGARRLRKQRATVGGTASSSLERAMKRAEATELANQRQMKEAKRAERKRNLRTAPGKMQSDNLPSMFSRPTLNLNSDGKRAVVQRPKDSALVRKLKPL